MKRFSRIAGSCVTIACIASAVIMTGLGCPPPPQNNKDGFPSLGVNRRFMDMGGVSATASATFVISNVGSGQLDYHLSRYSASTTMSPVQGSLTGDSQTINVNIDVSGVEPGPFGVPGLFTDLVTVESNGGQAQIEVTAIKVEGSDPIITSVVPNNGTSGDTLTISGANLAGGSVGLAAQTGPAVFFGGLEGTVSSFNNRTVTVTVPQGISADRVNVRVRTNVFSGPAPIDFYYGSAEVRPQAVGGIVRDELTGQPIVNAYIELQGQDTAHAAVTNQLGRFVFTPPPSIGVYFLTIGAEGYLWRNDVVGLDNSSDIDAVFELTAIQRQDFRESVHAYVVGNVYAEALGYSDVNTYEVVLPTVVLEDIGWVEVSDFIWAPSDQCFVIDLDADFDEGGGVYWESEDEALGLDAGEPIFFGGAAEGGYVELYHTYDFFDPYPYYVDEYSWGFNSTFYQGQTASFSAPGGYDISPFYFEIPLPEVVSGLPSYSDFISFDPYLPAPYRLSWEATTQPGTRVWLLIMPTDGLSTKIMVCNLIDDGRFVIPAPRIAQLGATSVQIFSYRVGTSLVPLTYPEGTWLMVFAQSYSDD